MDVLTQGLLGALAAQGAAGRQETRVAAGIGFSSALLADADVLIRSSEDPLLMLEYHRHFTHALVFIPIGALLAALLLWPILRQRLILRRLYLYSLLGYATAGLLDACTSYGTHLLWPFSDDTVAWSIIAIIDPLFSLILLAGMVAALITLQRKLAWYALLLAATYLLLGVVQHQRALVMAEQLAADRGIVPQRVLAKPTLGNLLLWRAIVVADGRAYVDAVRVGLLEGNKVYEGEAVTLVDPKTWYNLPKDSYAYYDLQRFYEFSDRLLIAYPDQPQLIGDLRYAMLPDAGIPLWGIRLDPEQPERRAVFEVQRELTPQIRARFMEMLQGNLRE
jgi:inner membrane protein